MVKLVDGDLHELERRARAAPSDMAAGRALVLGYERVGQRRKAFLELARLFREGDVEARERLDSWAGWSGRDGLGGTRSSEGPSVESSHVDVAPLGETLTGRFGGHQRILGAAGERLLLVVTRPSGERLVLVDLRRSSIAWERPSHHVPGKNAAFVGDDVVVATSDSLELVDGTSGDVIERSPLPASVVDLCAWGDRACLSLKGGPGLGVDVGADFGRALWRDDGNHTLLVAAHGGRAIEGHEVLRNLDDGSRVQSVTQPGEMTRLLAMDSSGGIVRVFGADRRGDRRIELRDSSLTRSLWTHPEGGQPLRRVEFVLTKRTVLWERRQLGESMLVALDRTTGEESWSAPRRQEGDCVVVGESVYQLRIEKTLRVVERSLASGERLQEIDTDVVPDQFDFFPGPAPIAPVRASATHDLVGLPGRLVCVTTADQQLTVVVIGRG